MNRSNEANDEYKIKVILVGDSGVGKTNIRERLCQNKFDPFSNKTVGVQFSTRGFMAPFQERLQKFSVSFWDVIGELQNPELLSAYFKNIMGVVYVFDLTSEDSLNNLKSWRDKIQQHNNACKIVQILIGSKKDLNHLRQVTRETAEILKKEMEIQLYYEVSALEENGGIQQAFFQYFATIAHQFNFGIKKPTKIRKPEAYHRSCI